MTVSVGKGTSGSPLLGSCLPGGGHEAVELAGDVVAGGLELAFHSQVMPFYPGDILSTGTPGAVPIVPGDVVRCELGDELASLTNPVR
jgi:hypothetical protein